MDENEISRKVIGAAIEVHRELGPGLLESVYQQCLDQELRLQKIRVDTELPVKVENKGDDIDVAYRLDMMIEDKVVLELKGVERILPIHEAKLLSYSRLTGNKHRLRLYFHVYMMKSGVRRVAMNL